MADTAPVPLLLALLAALVLLALAGALGFALGRSSSAARVAGLAAALDAERAARGSDARSASAAAGVLAEHAGAHLASAVEPLRRHLGDLEDHLAVLERQRAEAWGGLREQVSGARLQTERLRAETASLSGALRAGDVRGRWGEVQLHRVVELAGMAEHVDVTVQPTLRRPDGAAARPDLVVHLAGGRALAVDAKVPLRAWLDAQGAAGPAADASLRDHARALRAHVDALAARDYAALLPQSPDLVVLFVPSDAVLDAALRADAGLLEHAFERGVVPATPSTLVALLRTAALGHRQEALAAGTREVARVGAEMLERLATLGGHVDRVGRSLSTAVESYNRAVGSLESRVLVSARRMADLGVPGPSVVPPEPADCAPRGLVAPELLAPARPPG